MIISKILYQFSKTEIIIDAEIKAVSYNNTWEVVLTQADKID